VAHDEPLAVRPAHDRTQVAWIILVSAGLLEIVWAMALKGADGFTRLWPSVLAVVAALASFVMLSVSLKSLPVGTAYAVWVGIGAVGVALAGIVILGEAASPWRIGCLLIVVAGIIGLRMVEG
jgi:quaternary ammonium compound-resistance protein SugE